MVGLGSGAEREIEDIALTRYACYLIVQNSDPRKEVVALGQAYFAVQTRRQEIAEEYESLTEDQKRLLVREDLRAHHKSLSSAAKEAGIKKPFEFAAFYNEGYKGLYGGLTKNDIAKQKGISRNHDISDYMGSTELAANLFRATQTDEKLRRENTKDKHEANKTHYAVGKKVRQTMQELGGTMPENLLKVTISENTTHIGKDAFRKCDMLIIYTKEGSSADIYAKQNKIPVIYLK